MSEIAASAAMVDAVRRLEELNIQLPQVDFQTQMIAHGRMGVRWIFIPKGCTLTGTVTNIDNVCVVVGDISVTTEDGVKRLEGFNVLPAIKGQKRAGFAHEDTWWLTAWHTDATDPVEMEDEMTDESEMLQTRRAGIVFEAREALEG